MKQHALNLHLLFVFKVISSNKIQQHDFSNTRKAPKKLKKIVTFSKKKNIQYLHEILIYKALILASRLKSMVISQRFIFTIFLKNEYFLKIF